MIMNNELISVEKAVKTLKGLKKSGKNLRGVYPFQDSSNHITPDDFRVDVKNKEDKYFDDMDSALYFRNTTKNTLKLLEAEIDTELIHEKLN